MELVRGAVTEYQNFQLKEFLRKARTSFEVRGRTGVAPQLILRGVAEIAAEGAHVDVVHAGGLGREKTGLGVLEYQTAFGINLEQFRSAKKDIRFRFTVEDLVVADENLDLLLWPNGQSQ